MADCNSDDHSPEDAPPLLVDTPSSHSRSDILQEIDGPIHLNAQGAVALNAGPPMSRKFAWRMWTLVPGCTLAGYITHRFYRRYSPRRLPPLTSLRLAEIYFMVGAALTTVQYYMTEQYKACNDRDLLVIYLAGRRVNVRLPNGDFLGQKLRKQYKEDVLPKINVREVLQLSRGDDYYKSGIFGKIRSWDLHMWSDEITRDAWACILFAKLMQSEGKEVHLDVRDMVAASAFLARGSLAREERYRKWTLGTFALTIPVAILARRFGRRALYLPMNGVQRLLVWSWMYVDWFSVIGEWENIKGIRDKQKLAQSVTATFGSFDEDVAAHKMAWGDGL